MLQPCLAAGLESSQAWCLSWPCPSPAPGRSITVDQHQTGPSFCRSQKPSVWWFHHLWLSDPTCHWNMDPSTVVSRKPFPPHSAGWVAGVLIPLQKSLLKKQCIQKVLWGGNNWKGHGLRLPNTLCQNPSVHAFPIKAFKLTSALSCGEAGKTLTLLTFSEYWPISMWWSCQDGWALGGERGGKAQLSGEFR